MTGGTLENKDISVKGWNWGSTDVQGEVLSAFSDITMVLVRTLSLVRFELTIF